MNPSKDLKKTLRESLNEAEWTWLSPHGERHALIVVSQDLDLIEVGEKVALDDQERVQEWIASGRITKPSRAQTESWDATPEKRFITLIVQPYVLIQEKAH